LLSRVTMSEGWKATANSSQASTQLAKVKGRNGFR
jgi:hypothetical protein